MNIPRNDSKVNRLRTSVRRESVLGRWRSKSTHKIEAARELIVSLVLHQTNNWLGGSLSNFGMTFFLPGVEPEAIMKNTVVR
jgi:hypothetical protein